MGDRLESFERKAAEYCGVNQAIGVGHGSDALFLILKALNIGPGDEVITVAAGFPTTVNPISGYILSFCTTLWPNSPDPITRTLRKPKPRL